MQAYLDWEVDLINRLEQDGTLPFRSAQLPGAGTGAWVLSGAAAAESTTRRRRGGEALLAGSLLLGTGTM